MAMGNDNEMRRRDFVGTAGMAGLAALGVALSPVAAQAAIDAYPRLKAARDALNVAKGNLANGRDIFGGHRQKAIDAIDLALDEIKLAVDFADRNQ
jgi:hypothetical protein